MKVILISGLIASGKTTIGKELANELKNQNKKTKFYDLDDEVEKLNKSHEFESPEKKTLVWLKARKHVAGYANEMKDIDFVVVVGPFFLEDEIRGFTDFIEEKEVYLFNLQAPLGVRIERNDTRGHHKNDYKDIEDQNKKFQLLEESFGKNIDNTSEIKETIKVLISEIESSSARVEI